MESKQVSLIVILLAFSSCLYSGCQRQEQAVTEPNETVIKPISPSFTQGQQAGEDYIAGKLIDYRLTIILHSIEISNREDFLNGFKAAFVEAGQEDDGIKYAKILEDAVTGNQFETALELGSKHANRQVTNSRIQNLIQDSVGISGSMALGWKAGYILGFKTQKVSSAKEKGETISKELEEEFYKEASATYNALRAATGR